MTIFQPHKSKVNVIAISTSFIFLAVLGMAIVLMFYYNQLVNLRHEISKAQDAVQKATVANIDLKNKLYAVTDPKNLEKAAVSDAFVLEKNPKYFNSKPLAVSD